MTFKILQRKDKVESFKIMQKCYEYCLPLLLEKNLKVFIKEFIPKDPKLQGVNKGLKTMAISNDNEGKLEQVYDISVRLRHANNVTKFLKIHDIIGTMLHEIVHCYIGPHNSKFYQTLDDFWIRTQELNHRNLSTGRHEKPKINGYRLGGSNKPLNRDTLLSAINKRLSIADQKTCGTLNPIIDLTEISDEDTVIDLTL